MTDALTELQRLTNLDAGLLTKLLESVISIGALWLLQRLLIWLVFRRLESPRLRYRWRKVINYTAVALGVVVVARVWLLGLTSLATFLGLVSAGLAIALSDIVTGLAGWVFILTRRPFEVGDRIEIGEYRGDVIDQRPFAFSLMEIGNWVHADQSTGRIVHIPNGRVLREPLANYSQGFDYIWHELPVMVTFESDWEKAKAILNEAVTEHAESLSDSAARRVRMAARRYYIVFSKLTPIVYLSVEDSGVLLTIRFLCQPRRRRGTSEAIWEHVLREFAKHDDIDLAYPTQRIYNNRLEGKPGAGGKPQA